MKQLLVKYQNFFLTFYNRFKSKLKLNCSGQSLIEYMLILALLSSLSYGLLDQVNEKLAETWLKSINTISKNKKPLTKKDLLGEE